jgi:hypothetical protein
MGAQRRARREQAKESSLPSRALRMALGLAVGALAVLVYVNGLDNPFVYDDRDTVLLNPSLVDLSNVRFILLYNLFRPAVNVSYAIDRAFWGFASFGFHVTNVGLHVIVVVLFYGWCTRALEDARATSARDGATWPAFFAAAAYAVHPMMTEAAGYVSGRSEVLCAAGYLAALTLARRAILTGSRLTGAASLAAGLVALAAKETAVSLPLVLMAYDAWVLAPDEPSRARFRRRLWRVYLPCLIVLAIAALFRLRTLFAANAAAQRGPLENLLTQAIVIWRYVGLLIVPIGQTIMHRVRFVASPLDPVGLLALAAVIAVAAAAVWLRRRAPLVAVGIVWFVAAVAPSSSIVPLREGMAEHRIYLASGGLFLAFAAGLARPLAGSVAVRVVCSAALAVCAMLTVQRNRVWAEPTTLWAEAAAKAPDMWEPHYAYADSLRDAQQCDRAIGEYQKVIQLRPGHRDALTNLGICLGQAGQAQEAEAALRQALAIDPSWARGYTNLAALAITQGQHERARDYYLEALGRDPRNVLARMQLARLYESIFHDFHAAARMCGEARALAPATPGVEECVDRNRRLAAAHDGGR